MHLSRERRRGAAALFLVLAALAGVAGMPAAAPKPKGGARGDVIWTSPEVGARPLISIALLPAVAFDNDNADEKIVEAALGQALRGGRYRWVGPDLVKERLRSTAGGDSALQQIDGMVLRGVRVDSLAAPRLCGALRVDALLSLRVDRLEQIEMEFNQAGKPSTTVQLKAALVDSSGRLRWTASGSETAEGPYHDPGAGTMGVRSSGLSSTPVTGQAGAPAPDQVITVLVRRWAERFPAPPAAAAGDSTPVPAKTP